MQFLLLPYTPHISSKRLCCMQVIRWATRTSPQLCLSSLVTLSVLFSNAPVKRTCDWIKTIFRVRDRSTDSEGADVLDTSNEQLDSFRKVPLDQMSMHSGGSLEKEAPVFPRNCTHKYREELKAQGTTWLLLQYLRGGLEVFQIWFSFICFLIRGWPFSESFSRSIFRLRPPWGDARQALHDGLAGRSWDETFRNCHKFCQTEPQIKGYFL